MRLLKIDESNRSEHFFLSESDQCFYFGELTPGKGYQHSKTNQLISNLKKPVSKKHKEEYKYKETSIKFCAQLLGNIAPEKCSFIPIPPSKAASDPDYDDRLKQILDTYNENQGQKADIREVFTNRVSLSASHTTPNRSSIEDLKANYIIDELQLESLRPYVIVFDDVITTGRHFKAIQQLIQDNNPKANIVGVFIARRKLNNPFEVEVDL